MDEKPRSLELLAPAKDADVAREAILHGADAVYIGPPSHGARKSASNSLDDIRRTVDFAHQFRAKVYVTVNTIVYDSELLEVEKMITSLYRAGVDAIIVQDMGILRLDIPPIALHASTQCDNETAAKARFLQDVGFSQIVMARELTVDELRDVCRQLTIPVEVFVHGALCVSFSGRCHASYHACGRSANRGECAQLCRLPYTLRDSHGKAIATDRHLLSLKDLNASDRLNLLAEAGASSFKIEGRLKDAAYVKNVTAFYRRKLDELISAYPERYYRASHGISSISFEPNPDKSFNRSFTHYFIDGPRLESSIASIMTPKSLGEEILTIEDLHNGDGISWFDRDGIYVGALVNGIKGGKILTSDGRKIILKGGIRRTYDLIFQKTLSKLTARRTIAVDISLDAHKVTATDERGVCIVIPHSCTIEKARSPQDRVAIIGKLGGTIYRLRDFKSSLGEDVYIPPKELTALRHRITELLDIANIDTYRFDYRQKENADAVYPSAKLDYRANVSNALAREFYADHGVKQIEPALELYGKQQRVGITSVMTTRHCILRELGVCKKNTPKEKRLAEPLILQESNSGNFYTLKFDCYNCRMQLLIQPEK